MKEYNGWLTSPNILKRSLAVWGHFILGYFLVLIIIGIPMAFLIALLG